MMIRVEKFTDTTTVARLKYAGRILVATIRNFWADNCLGNAASLTYTTLFAIVPLLTVLYSILALFPSFHGVGTDIQNFVFSNFVPSASKVVSDWLTSFSSQARNLTFIGIGFLIVTALMMLYTVDCAINGIFHASESRRPVTSILLYWMILTVGPLLLGLGFAATSYLATLQFLDDAFVSLGLNGILLSIFPFVMNVVTFTLLYILVPKCRVSFYHALAGGIFVGVIFTITRIGFTYAMQISPTYEFIYGAFAAVPIFLVWIFLSWLMILMGAELVHALGEPRSRDYRGFSQLLSMVAILATCNKRFDSGQSTDLVDVRAQGWPVNQRHWEEVTTWLIDQDIIGRHSSGLLVPARSFDAVPFEEVVYQCPWGFPKDHELQALNLALHPQWFAKLIADFETLNRIGRKQLSGSLTQRLTDQEQGVTDKEPDITDKS